MIFIAFVVLAVYALPKIEVEAIPEVDLPTISVTTRWNGASPKAIQRRSDKDKLISIIRTFFVELKGWHVQYNIVSRETLIAAKQNPEEYRDLIVRVAGYSAFFTMLSPDTQDDIIDRTEHSLS